MVRVLASGRAPSAIDDEASDGPRPFPNGGRAGEGVPTGPAVLDSMLEAWVFGFLVVLGALDILGILGLVCSVSTTGMSGAPGIIRPSPPRRAR